MKLTKLLTGHTNIGIDFDETLIDHAISPEIQEFVIKNYKRCNFFIVTHRSSGWAGSIWEDLDHESYGKVRDFMFKKLLTIPISVYESFAQKDTMRNRGYLSGPLTTEEIAYFDWKGKICAKHDITILIDDKPLLNGAGCTKYGVSFVNTHDITSAKKR